MGQHVESESIFHPSIESLQNVVAMANSIKNEIDLHISITLLFCFLLCFPVRSAGQEDRQACPSYNEAKLSAYIRNSRKRLQKKASRRFEYDTIIAIPALCTGCDQVWRDNLDTLQLQLSTDGILTRLNRKLIFFKRRNPEVRFYFTDKLGQVIAIYENGWAYLPGLGFNKDAFDRGLLQYIILNRIQKAFRLPCLDHNKYLAVDENGVFGLLEFIGDKNEFIFLPVPAKE